MITGTGTLWNNPIFGIASGQMIFVPGAGQVVIYEILAVDSDTKIRVTKNISSAITNSEYAIVTTVSNSMSDLARRTAVQLALYQKLLEDWQNITTGTGDVTIIAPDGTEVVIPALSWISDSKTWFDTNKELIENAGEAVAGAGVARDQAVAANTAAQAAKTAAEAAAASVNLGPLGIGLLSMTGIDSFDFQTFVFTSGANYLASSTNWINVPSEISYPAGLAISIKVDYVTGTQIGLEIKPSTVSSTNFRAWYLRLGGYPGSRIFTAREIQTSDNPVPIIGGGTGANTLAGAQTALGIVPQLIIALYPGGSAGSPPSISINQRIEVANPLPGRNINLRVEILSGGKWGDPGFGSNIGSGSQSQSFGVVARDYNGAITIVSGLTAVGIHSNMLGNGFSSNAGITTAQYRVIVWTIG
ncbi:TPA: hypothetical protein ACJS4R_002245 [Yersinia enterocolitica]